MDVVFALAMFACLSACHFVYMQLPQVSSHNPKLDDTQHPAEPVLARAVTRATVPQNPLELIQSWMHMKEGSSGAPVAALAIGLCVGLVVLVYLCWVVYRWLSSSNKCASPPHLSDSDFALN